MRKKREEQERKKEMRKKERKNERRKREKAVQNVTVDYFERGGKILCQVVRTRARSTLST